MESLGRFFRHLSYAFLPPTHPRGEVERIVVHPDNFGLPLAIDVDIAGDRWSWTIYIASPRNRQGSILAHGWGSSDIVAMNMAEDTIRYLRDQESRLVGAPNQH